MKRPSQAIPFAAGAGMICLILESRYAVDHAAAALNLCLSSVIPCLFPMLVLSALMLGGFGTGTGRFSRRVEQLLGLPHGTGGLFVLGLVGGFPVGAQCLSQGVQSGGLSREDARRLLGLCNHCGPGFLFGVLGNIFSQAEYPLVVALIQLETAVICATLFCSPDSLQTPCRFEQPSLTQAVSRAIRSMGIVCAWVILAGVITGFLERWLFPLLPEPSGTILSGLLELTGGVLGLRDNPSENQKLLLCCLFVCFGGGCVQLQIQSVAAQAGIPADLCIRQKCLQGALGVTLAAVFLRFGFVCTLIFPALAIIWKKAVAFPRRTVYNKRQRT